MTPAQRSVARHALGLPNKRKTTYRNHFVTGEGSSHHALWLEMVDAGLARRRAGNELTGGDDLFRLTLAGAQAALIRGERLSVEDWGLPERTKNDASQRGQADNAAAE